MLINEPCKKPGLIYFWIFSPGIPFESHLVKIFPDSPRMPYMRLSLILVMIRFTGSILQFGEKGEKTGWSYIAIPGTIAGKLKPDNKKSFRVKGKLDGYAIRGLALLPMGEGNFILVLNAKIRKEIGKGRGATLSVCLELDNRVPKPPAELMECLKDSPQALAFFKTLPMSHQNYFGKWISDAKTEATQAKRIASTIMALEKKAHFGQMMQMIKKEKEQ